MRSWANQMHISDLGDVFLQGRAAGTSFFYVLLRSLTTCVIQLILLILQIKREMLTQQKRVIPTLVNYR